MELESHFHVEIRALSIDSLIIMQTEESDLNKPQSFKAFLQSQRLCLPDVKKKKKKRKVRKHAIYLEFDK